MGGRGSSSGMSGGGALPKGQPEVTISTYYRQNSRFGSHYGDSVYEASEVSPGHINFSYAQPHFPKESQKANTKEVEFKIKHGAETHYNNGNTKFHGINWSKVNQVSGQTYSMRSDLKDMGFRWDKGSNSWKK